MRTAYGGVIGVALMCACGVSVYAGAEEKLSADRLYTQALSRERALRLPGQTASRTLLTDLRNAVAAYEEIVRLYPRSGYSDNALWQASGLALESYELFRQPHDLDTGLRLLETLFTQYPASSLGDRVPDRIRQLEMLRRTVRVTDIRREVLPEVIRVTVELDGEARFHFEDLANPARVFFDLRGTTAEPPLRDATLAFEGDVVREIRTGRHPNHTTRIVLDTTEVARYRVFTLYDPYRIVIDCERQQPLSLLADRSPQPAPLPAAPIFPLPRNGGEGQGEGAKVGPPKIAGGSLIALRTPSPFAVSLSNSWPMPPGPRPSDRGVSPDHEPARVDGAPESNHEHELALRQACPEHRSFLRHAPDERCRRAQGERISATDEIDDAGNSTAGPAALAPPQANVNGQLSLARQLGLGIARIVIDPGHGGHDPGARAAGLVEAALVLDIAHRLERRLLDSQQFEVVLTRRADGYVSLQERTAVANRTGADLFLSIHANASRDWRARGVETYFLDFATDSDAQALAARENAVSADNMRNLPAIVRTITTNTKVDESREFAQRVQAAMVDHLRPLNPNVQNLGVKQAPFVVLIGAGMPSILAEVSFLTNSDEARLLGADAYRDRIADALFEGILQYQRSLKAADRVALIPE